MGEESWSDSLVGLAGHGDILEQSQLLKLGLTDLINISVRTESVMNHLII